MKHKIFSITCLPLIFLIIDANSGGLAQAQSSVSLSESSQVSIQGIGRIKIGMTISQATKSAKINLVQEGSARKSNCIYYKPAGKKLGGVHFMVTNGIVSRIEITNPHITTISGAKIGNSEEQIRSLYGSQIQTKNHKYLDRGHYLIFTSRDQQDHRNQILFETDGVNVINWRVGRVKEVGWVEGCS